MRILIAPDKFKGTLSARAVAEAMAEGVRRVLPDASLDLCPLSDGGEGFVEALVTSTEGTFHTARVTGPLPDMKVGARYGFLGSVDSSILKTAVIEMSAASGLALLKPDQYDPFATTTFGTGEMIVDAIRHGARHILLGIGGSATVDGGIGAAHACGFTILMKDGEPTSPSEPLCGRDVPNVLMVKHGRGEVTSGIPITVACDVTNPLFGPIGAAQVYGKQKGATSEQIAVLDAAFAAIVSRAGTSDLANTPGAGAAGGLGYGMLAYFGATLQNGFSIVAKATQLDDRAKRADVVLTGEGRFDASSLHGKVVAPVAGIASSSRVPCLAICGDREKDLPAPRLLTLAALTDVVTKDVALHDTRRVLADRVAMVLQNWLDHSNPEKS